MGYTTEFEGSFHIDPPLVSTQVAFLQSFSEERHEDPRLPGYWCDWTPTDDGTALIWNGAEKFYRSEQWLSYLIDTFLCPAAFTDSLVAEGFSRPHTLTGSVAATGQDGKRWTIECCDNTVSIRDICGPKAATFQVFLFARGDDPDADREYDAAFDLPPSHAPVFTTEFGPLRDAVAAFLHESPQIDVTPDPDGLFVDAERAIEIDVHRSGSILVDADVAAAMRTDPDAAFANVITLCAKLAEHLNWVAHSPARRSVLRPGPRFRAEVVSQMSGWLQYG